ncbi:MAG: lactonase family protein [Pirellulales bacterium]
MEKLASVTPSPGHGSGRLTSRLRLLLVGSAVWLAASSSVLAGNFLYLSVPGDKRIAVYARDGQTGALTAVQQLRTTGEPAALATDPQHRFLFASYRPEGQLAAFRRDPSSGQLTLVNVVDAGSDPAHLSVDASGQWLLAAYYVAAQVTVHRIARDGSLSATAHQNLRTREKAHAIVLDRTQRVALVPHTGPNAIFQFAFDARQGQLTALDPLVFTTPPGQGPRHAAFHPRLDVVYINNEQGNSVTAYACSAAAPRLQPLGTASTLPGDFSGTNATAELKVHPSGRWAYCANRGHDSLAWFTLDATTGTLTRGGIEPTEPTPRSFDLTSDGQFLYAGGESSGKLAGYRVSADRGTLERFGTWEIGPRLWWVLAIEER